MTIATTSTTYQRIHPFALDAVDVFHLVDELVDHDFPAASFLDGRLDHHFSPSSGVRQKLNHLFFENRNQQKLWGARDLAIGYPMLRQDENTFVPVFIWPIQLLKEVPGGNKEWVMQTPPDRSPYLNPFLETILATDFPEEWASWTNRIPWSKAGLQGFLKKISNFLEVPIAGEQESSMIPFSGIESAESEATPSPAIHQAGILSFFNYLAVREDKVPGTSEKEYEKEPESTGHHFGLLDLTPAQQNAVETALSHPVSQWVGVPGSGKKKALLYLLSHGLATGKRFLVLSDRLGPLTELQEQLHGLQLGAFSFFFRDPYSDLSLLRGLLQGISERSISPGTSMSNELSTALNQADRMKERLDESHTFFQQPLLGQWKWTRIVGNYLRFQEVEGKERLSNLLSPDDFQFEVAEYNQLLTVLDRSRQRYEAVNTLKHPLSDLHESLFTEYDFPKSEARVRDLVNRFLTKADRLQYQFVSDMDTFRLRLSDHFHDYALRLAARSDRLAERIQDFVHFYGKETAARSNSNLRLKGIFSSKAKEIREKREVLLQEYRALQDYFLHQSYFDFQFLPVGNQGKELLSVEKNLQDLKDQLEQWKSNIPEIVQEELGRWQSGSVHPGSQMEDRTQVLEELFDEFLDELNASELFAYRFEHSMLTLPKKHKYLESVREQIEHIRLNFRDYHPVYYWLRHWLQLDNQSQRVVHALIKARPHDWETAFSSWYLHHCLEQSYQDVYIRTEEDLEHYATLQKQLRERLPDYVTQTNLARQQQAAKDWRRMARPSWQELHQLRPEKTIGREVPAQLLHSAWPHLSRLFPVTLMPLHAARYFFQEADCPYDSVIFVEAEDIFESDLKHWRSRVPRQLLIRNATGQELEGVEHDSDSVAEFERTWPALAELDSWVQGTPALVPKPDIHYVGGTYHEQTRTNETEAEALLQLINQIKPTPQRTYPSVGLITLTCEQRNQVADFLSQIKRKRKPGSEKIQQLERNGLSVLTLEEVAGLKLDELYLACTWGGGGELAHDLQEMDQERLKTAFLHLIRSGTALKRVIHSFDRNQLQQLTELPQTTGRFLLGAYLFYLSSAVARSNLSETWQARLFGHSPLPPPETVFVNELLQQLGHYFTLQDIRVNQSGAQVYLPLSFRIEGSDKRILLIPDGFLVNHLPRTSYEWEWELRNHLRDQYDLILTVWSANWWRNPESEARKLASQLLTTLNLTTPSLPLQEEE